MHKPKATNEYPLYRFVEWQDDTKPPEIVRVVDAAHDQQLYNSRQWSMISGGYSTAEDVRAADGILDNCVECGHMFRTQYLDSVKARLIANHTCHACDFWREKVRWKEQNDPVRKCVRVNGQHYVFDATAASITDPRELRWAGHGGHVFRIKFHDDKNVVVTNNLWFQGRIPAHFAERLPDNAEFVNLK